SRDLAERSEGHRNHRACVGRTVRAPTNRRTVGTQRARVLVAGADLNESLPAVARNGASVRLTTRIEAPAEDDLRVVFGDSAHEIRARRDLQEGLGRRDAARRRAKALDRGVGSDATDKLRRGARNRERSVTSARRTVTNQPGPAHT